LLGSCWKQTGAETEIYWREQMGQREIGEAIKPLVRCDEGREDRVGYLVEPKGEGKRGDKRRGLAVKDCPFRSSCPAANLHQKPTPDSIHQLLRIHCSAPVSARVTEHRWHGRPGHPPKKAQ
jgi:hypothetical protein